MAGPTVGMNTDPVRRITHSLMRPTRADPGLRARRGGARAGVRETANPAASRPVRMTTSWPETLLSKNSDKPEGPLLHGVWKMT